MKKFLNEIIPSGIGFCLTCEKVSKAENCLHLSLSKKGMIGNMQNDCSAFEAWAICFKAKYPEIESVQIDWDPVNLTTLKASELGHYYRALYRLFKFEMNYPSWVKISPSIPESFIQEMNKWVLNYPTKGCSESQKEKENAESKLEREIVQIIQRSCEIGDEQLPVGLFKDYVSKETSRSPRGLSQIDLWSIDKGIFSIYELKNDENIAVGIISELLLYTNIMSDFVSHIFNYPDSFTTKKNHFRHAKELYESVLSERIINIQGVMLADRIHPLITPETIALLNTNSNKVKYSWETVSDLKKSGK